MSVQLLCFMLQNLSPGTVENRYCGVLRTLLQAIVRRGLTEKQKFPLRTVIAGHETRTCLKENTCPRPDRLP